MTWPSIETEGKPAKKRGGAGTYARAVARGRTTMPCGKTVNVTVRDAAAITVLKDRAAAQCRLAGDAHIRGCKTCKERLT